MLYKYVFIGLKTHIGQIPFDTKHVCALPHTKTHPQTLHLHVIRLSLLTVWRAPGRPAPTGQPGGPGPEQQELEGPQ